MSTEVERLLALAAEVLPADRARVLACASSSLRNEVDELLRYADEAETYFDQAIQGAASFFLTEMEPRPGDVIGSYRVVRLIDQGGMGSVYLAERADGEIDQRVAIKLLRADGFRSGWRERFLRERQLLASLHHPSIVHVLDAGRTEDGRPFLVMEHVDGLPIDQYARGIGVTERLKLLMRVCEGVSYAHRHLIVHRDLKPSNILVDAAGRPKLLDFGIAKLLNETGEVTTAADQLLTPDYASPEQLRGEAQSTATDIYSLAAVLYKLLTGMTPRACARETQPGRCSPPSHLNPNVPVDVDYVMAKALREEPEERYSTVSEFANDLQAVLERRPVQARSSDFWYRTRRYVRGYWAPLSASLLVITSLGVGLGVANHERELADRERTIAERRFTDVRQLADKLFDIDVQVAQLQGGSKTRQLIVDTALEYLRRLSVDAHMEPHLALELGTAYMRVARVQGVNISPNLGHTAEAERTAQVAQSLNDSVLRSEPGNRMALLRAGQIAHDRMLLAAADDRSEQVLPFAQVCIDRLNQFLATRPLNATADHADAQQVIIAFINVANQYVKADRFEEAVRTAQHSIDISRATGWPTQAGAALMVVALARRAEGQLDEALQAIQESVRLLQPEPGETRVGRLQPYGLALIREGEILGEDQGINLNRPGEAIAYIQRGLDIAQKLAARDDSDFGSQYRTFTAETELAGIVRHTDPARASALYDDALQRIFGHEVNESTLEEIAEAQAASVYPLLQLHRRAEAWKRLNEAIEHLRHLGEYPARQIELGSAADVTLRAVADYQVSIGHLKEGVAQYEELLHLLSASVPRAEKTMDDAVDLANIYGAAAQAERRSGHIDAAADLEARRLKLWRFWASKLPDSSFVRRELRMAVGPA